jgi:hypothetical protein
VATRGFAHMMLGEHAEAARWTERGARSPVAHVLIAMVAAAAHSLSGDGKRADFWAANARERNGSLMHADFFRAFPIRSDAMRASLKKALGAVGLR